MARAGGTGGGVSSILTEADDVTTDAYVEIFEDVASALLGTGTIKNIGAQAATGLIECADPNAVTSGQTITIDDGVNPATIFEIRKSGAAAPGHVLVTIGLTPTPASAAAALLAAINGVGAGLAITASVGALPEDVALVNDATGAAGNVAITHTAIGFLPSGMSGGTDAGNDMTVRETVTDRFGVTDATTETVVSPGAANDYLLNPQTFFGAARPPYVSYKVEVKATVPGSQTAYSLNFDGQGED
jgi:hypothetical protein